MKRHIMCERDVGLFSLIQQVIANIPWALTESRVPIALFQSRTCYWTSGGYRDRDTVWEYYFEPLVAEHPAESIPAHIRKKIAERPPTADEIGYAIGKATLVTAHFGDHPDAQGALYIPYDWNDPSDELRGCTSTIVSEFVRPRNYIRDRVHQIVTHHEISSNYTIGVHARGTDALVSQWHPHRRDSLKLPKYKAEIERLLSQEPDGLVFVASDDQSSIEYFREAFGKQVVALDSVRHTGGRPAGQGPLGGIMPAYIADDPEKAAINGEDAVVEYEILRRCNWLVHNGASLARTVLLAEAKMEHTNTHVQDSEYVEQSEGQ